ncbi:hypothetical protein KX729_28685 [Rhizobium sp. XQZ8]|uniref:hypothetical protein n=1 Tax=Rhizobium populisoli TaxID=2859785 RepID=UPI001CA4CB16|nr:hypothetical protein [Rhizobium populisoli]MBW6425407.1 hypothetical protein [Rhizobium populisoli]
MSRRIAFRCGRVIVVLAVVIAVVDQAMMSVNGDHPTPAVRDPRNPAAQAPSQ